MSTAWTREQQQVIDGRGESMLVSAAAGSGKTAVLTERIISLVTDPKNPVDIDRILVVTFTVAAAQEMRQRIRDALKSRSAGDPGDAHLRRQMALIAHARISTIHSFCLDVIRSGFDRIGLDPSFRIADEGELKLMRIDAASGVIEEAYAQEDPAFLHFAECFAPGRDDSVLEDTILSFYDQSVGNPYPAAWRADCIRQMQGSPEETPWMQAWIARARERSEYATCILQEALALAGEPDGPYMYEEMLRSDLALARSFSGCEGYESWRRASENLVFSKLSSRRDLNVSEEKKERAKDLREEAREQLREIAEGFSVPLEELREQCAREQELAATLCRLTDAFDRRYEAARREKNVLSFDDLEHLALQILVEKDESTCHPTELALEYARSFEEVMIDEYQDSNLVQELILGAVSCPQGRENRFMVGDVKQSIYRFRLARPQLFLEKYDTYHTPGKCRIDLRKNFRSRQQVLHFVNRIFERIMRRELGGIAYDEDAALYPGATYPDLPEADQSAPQVLLISEAADGERESGEPRDLAEADASLQEGNAREREARLVCRRIREIKETQMVYDRALGRLRPARYGDMAVLLRSPAGWVDTFLDVFAAEQIPVLTTGATGYFSALEVRTILSFLSVLDNVRQDIPLAGALRSPLGGFSSQELARIRCEAPEGDLYGSCKAFLETREPADPLGERLARFFEMVDKLRQMAVYTPMDELLTQILSVTGYDEIVSAMPGGQRRRANLNMLIEKAAAYESTSYRGLFNFIRYIENLKKYEIDYGEAAPGAGDEDAVRILSIHKSKGLEYPIVFVSGLGKRFNLRDTQGMVCTHQDLGVGLDLVDPVARTRMSPLRKRAISACIREEDLSEEMRVLYVAMTRAREKLILTGHVGDGEAFLARCAQVTGRSEDQLSALTLTRAATPLDWIVPALLYEQAGAQTISLVSDRSLAAGEVTDEMRGRYPIPMPEPGRVYSQKVRDWMQSLTARRYPYEQVENIPGKVSVSLLKHLHMEQVEAQLQELFPYEDGEGAKKRGTEGGMAAAAARGTLYHRVMECLDFAADFDENFVSRQLETMCRCGKIRKDVLHQIDQEKIRAFLETELAARMQRAQRSGRLHREAPFVLGLPARQVRQEWDAEETVLVQGIIDVWFQEEDGLVLLDYKTDVVPKGGSMLLAERYRAQMAYYGMALSRLRGQRVKEIWIYSFHNQEAIRADQ